MPRDITATVAPGPRAKEWQSVFGAAAVPIQSPFGTVVTVCGAPTLVYFVDLAALTLHQHARLVAHLAERFQMPQDEVERDLAAKGCPILAEGVTVTIRNAQAHLDWLADLLRPG